LLSALNDLTIPERLKPQTAMPPAMRLSPMRLSLGMSACFAQIGRPGFEPLSPKWRSSAATERAFGRPARACGRSRSSDYE